MKLDEARIVDAAWAILEEGGSGAVAMRAVAERLGVTTPALYKHVGGHDALLDALRRRGWERFGAALIGGLRAADPVGRLGATGEAYLDFGLAHPQVYRLLFMDQPTAPLPEGTPRHGPSFQVLLDRVAEAQAAGRIAAERDVYTLGILLWSVVHGLVSLYVGGGASRAMSREAYVGLARAVLREQLELLCGPGSGAPPGGDAGEVP